MYSTKGTQVEGLSFFGAVLAFLSTIVGGGIVGIPAAFYQAGIPFALFLNLLFGFFSSYACNLYLHSSRICGGLESFSEIGYRVMGRASIFIIAGIVLVTSILLIVLFFTIFGQIFASIVEDASDSGAPSFFLKQPAYVLLIAAINIPLILK